MVSIHCIDTSLRDAFFKERIDLKFEELATKVLSTWKALGHQLDDHCISLVRHQNLLPFYLESLEI